MPIKNIIFDLGGVILNLDYNRTFEAFRKLGASNFELNYNRMNQDHLFDHYETGKLSTNAFRDALKAKFGIIATDEEFDHAWNAMLLDIPQNRLDFIKSLREKYKLFLFSNTNDLHLKEFFNICQNQHELRTLTEYFEKEYYSNRLGKRKPNPDAFTSILLENNMQAIETVFVDDTLQHVLGAKQAGLHAMHLSEEKSIFDVIEFIAEIS